MTRIGYVLKMYPRFSETFIVNEILELERRGVDVRIYSLMKPNDGRFHASLSRVKAGVVYVPEHVFAERKSLWPAHQALLRRDPRRYVSVLGYALSRGHRYAVKRFFQAGLIAEHVLRHPLDGLHAHFASSAARAASFVQRLIGTPYSFTAHAKDIFHEEVNADSLRGKIRGARFVVTVSNFNRDYLRRLAGSAGDLRRLYNGIDLDVFRPEPGAQREPGLVLGVGRLVEKKGFEDLIQAVGLLRDQGRSVRCEIIGKGPLEEALRQQIAALGLGAQVALVGPRPQDQVLAAYHRASVFALPCVIGKDGNRDGLPTVLLEAMAAGLPVISTDVTGVPEIIDHGINGLIVPQHDPAALAVALAEVLDQPQRAAALAVEARRKVALQFDVTSNVATLQGWLSEGGSLAEGRVAGEAIALPTPLAPQPAPRHAPPIPLETAQ